MAAALGVTLIKRFTYRGNASEEWSNTYWLTGVAPVTPTEWKSLYDALIAQEKTMYLAANSVVRAYGYNSDSPTRVAVDSHDYLAAGAAVAGTMTLGTGTFPAGDQAAWIRFKTPRLTIKGKPIYLRKYFHGVPVGGATAGTEDNVGSNFPAAATAFETFLKTTGVGGFGTITGRGHADTIVSSTHSTFITTRTLKRRGKRPH